MASPFAVLYNFAANREMSYSFHEWSQQISKGWVKYFLENGLAPFLKHFGYTIEKNETNCKKLLYWAWSHVFVNASNPDKNYCIRHNLPIHNGGEEEFDYFLYKIADSDWEQFFEEWWNEEWLDTSEAGMKQRRDFPNMVYRLLELEKSPAHRKWCDLMGYTEDNGDSYSDKDVKDFREDYDVGYGGDRRTY